MRNSTRIALFIAMLILLVAVLSDAMAPISHTSVPTGDPIVDNIGIPVGVLTLSVAILLGIADGAAN